MLRALLLLIFATCAIGQHDIIQVSDPNNPGGTWPRGIMIHDWNEMPNIVHNILNAHWNRFGTNARAAPGGLIRVIVTRDVGGGPQTVYDYNNTPELNNYANPLQRGNGGAAARRNIACGGTYCRKRFLDDHIVASNGIVRYDTGRPPLVGTPFTFNSGLAKVVAIRRDRPNHVAGVLTADYGTILRGTTVDLPDFFSCDEYPFASSANGAANARLSCVGDYEQDRQKLVTGGFYTMTAPHPTIPNNNIVVTPYGQFFYTAVINVPQVIYDMLSTPAGIPDYCDVDRGANGIPTAVSCL